MFNRLESVSQIVDDALESAAEAQTKTSEKANEKFKDAIDALSSYEKKCLFNETVAESMAAAEAKDNPSSAILNKLKGKLREVLQVNFAQLHTNTNPHDFPAQAVCGGADDDGRVPYPQVPS